MNAYCVLFAAKVLNKTDIENKRVIELGAQDINGNLRPLIELYQPQEYIGVDIMPGRGVDVICDIRNLISLFGPASFDLVIATEILEHIQDWKSAIHNIKTIIRPQGSLFMTARSTGFPYHGYPFDFWRFEPEDLTLIFRDFRVEIMERDPALGVFLKCRKPRDFVEQDLKGVDLYSIIYRRRVEEFADREAKSFFYRRFLWARKVRGKIRRFLDSL